MKKATNSNLASHKMTSDNFQCSYNKLNLPDVLASQVNITYQTP
jgi:hypothetical protein